MMGDSRSMIWIRGASQQMDEHAAPTCVDGVATLSGLS